MVTRTLDPDLLRAFATVADQGSMTVASQTLHLTQGAVSQRIARLEALAGAPLLLRDRRGLRPTPSGRRLLEKARRLLALNDEIWADLADGAVGGSVRLGVPYDLVGTLLAPALGAFAAACPDVELTLTCGASPDLRRAVAAHALDLAVVEEPVGLETGESLAVDRLVWVGARGGAAQTRDPLPVSLVAETCAFRPVVVAALTEHGRPWRSVFENGGLDATMATVRMDLAVSAWLAGTVPSDLDILPPGSGLPALPPFAVTLHRASTAQGAACDELQSHIRAHVGRAG